MLFGLCVIFELFRYLMCLVRFEIVRKKFSNFCFVLLYLETSKWVDELIVCHFSSVRLFFIGMPSNVSRRFPILIFSSLFTYVCFFLFIICFISVMCCCSSFVPGCLVSKETHLHTSDNQFLIWNEESERKIVVIVIIITEIVLCSLIKDKQQPDEIARILNIWTWTSNLSMNSWKLVDQWRNPIGINYIWNWFWFNLLNNIPALAGLAETNMVPFCDLVPTH